MRRDHIYLALWVGLLFAALFLLQIQTDPDQTRSSTSTTSSSSSTTSPSTTSTTTTSTTIVEPPIEVEVPTVPESEEWDSVGHDESPVLDLSPAQGFTATVSWYGSESGSTTANGEDFDPYGHTFASRAGPPYGGYLTFCHQGNCVTARHTDYGPAAWTGHDYDLSQGAFAAIAPLGAGVIEVTVS